jgi:hypothetical protein
MRPIVSVLLYTNNGQTTAIGVYSSRVLAEHVIDKLLQMNMEKERNAFHIEDLSVT